MDNYQNSKNFKNKNEKTNNQNKTENRSENRTESKSENKNSQHSENSLPPTKRALKVAYFKESKTDPQGSYTGTPKDPTEKPIQDVDDL